MSNPNPQNDELKTKALEAAIALAATPILLADPRTAEAYAKLVALIDDGKTALAPTGARVKSPTYAVSRWLVAAIDAAGCAHSTRLVVGLSCVHDGGN